MLPNQSLRHALRLLLELARAAGRPRHARDLAATIEIPPYYASKILSSLAAAGIVRARRGRSGGVELKAAPHELTWGDVADAISPGDPFAVCPLGHSPCDDLSPCPLHEHWRRVRDAVQSELRARTLADLAGRAGSDDDWAEVEPHLPDELL